MADQIGLELDSDTLYLTRGRDFKWLFENTDTAGDSVDYPAGELYFELDTKGQHNALQEVRVSSAVDGSYTLSLDGHPTAAIEYYDITADPFTIASEVQAALEALPNVGAGNVLVHPAALVPAWRIAMALNDSVNEVQEITWTGTAQADGTFRLGYGAEASTPIAYDATEAAVEAALNAIPGIGAGNTSVTALPQGNGWRVEFVGLKAATNVKQITAYTSGVDPSLSGGFFGLLDAAGAFLGGLIGLLTGGLFHVPTTPTTPTQTSSTGPAIQTRTVVNGQAKLNEPLVKALESTITALYNSFSVLSGVSLDFTVQDHKHATVKVTCNKSFTEDDQLIFDVDVSAAEIQGAIDHTSGLVGVIASYTVDFYWDYVYQVEFVGDLAETAQPALVPDITNLVGASDDNEQDVVVTVLKPGKARFTKWPFVIDGSTASLAVQSEDAALVLPRTLWQLVFLPEGETSGGDPIARGKVAVQE